MGRIRAVALTLLLVGACRTRPLATSTDSPPALDAAAMDDAASCALVPIPLDSLQGDDLNLCPSDLVRVTFRITLDACQPVRPPIVRYDGATNGYSVTAQACNGPRCQPPPVVVERTVFLSETARPAPGMVTVRDGAPGGSIATLLSIQNLVHGACGTVNGTGCRSDAECQAVDPATRCWYDGGQCERICFDDGDCVATAPHCAFGFCGR